MASNREKLVNLIVANSNLEPSEATELIEEYTNNVADNEVENLINAMTEALGTKVGNKLDANGIKEVFDIAREHSNIKTDQEVAEEQARKQAIDEKQARRTEKAYDIIDQRREQKKEQQAEKKEQQAYKKARFNENKKVINTLDIYKDPEYMQKLIKRYSGTMKKQYTSMTIGSVNHLAQKEAFQDFINELNESITSSTTIPEEKKEEIKSQAIAQEEAKLFLGDNATELDAMVLQSIHKNGYEYGGIKEAEEFLKLMKTELQNEKDPEKIAAIRNSIHYMNKFIENELRAQKELESNEKLESVFLDEDQKIGNTQIRRDALSNEISRINRELVKIRTLIRNANTVEEKKRLKDLYAQYSSQVSDLNSSIKMEKIAGEEIDVVLREGIESGEITAENYTQAIVEYKGMRIKNELNSATIQIEEARKKLEEPNLTTDQRMNLLEEIYLAEKGRLSGTLKLFGGQPSLAINSLQEKGITRNELRELNMYRLEKSDMSEEEKQDRLNRMNETDLLVTNLENTFENLLDKGYAYEDIIHFVSAIQEGKGKDNYKAVFSLEGGNKRKTFNGVINAERYNLKPELVEDFYEDFALRVSENPNGTLAIFSDKSFEFTQGLSEIWYKFKLRERIDEMEKNNPFDNEVQNVESQTRNSVKNITAGVKKDEMDSVTKALTKDKEKADEEMQQQADTNLELDS